MWISKKKWERLNDKLATLYHLEKAINETPTNMGPCFIGDAVVLSLRVYDEIMHKAFSPKENESKTYKKLYLDELQKRLELADRVRELEGE